MVINVELCKIVVERFDFGFGNLVRCVLHLSRDLGVEKETKGIMTSAARATSHRAYDYFLKQLEERAGKEVRDKFEKMKYKTSFLFVMDLLAPGETTYGITNNNIVETMNKSQLNSRLLSVFDNVVGFLGKMEQRNGAVFMAAEGQLRDGNNVTLHAKARVVALGKKVDEEWRVHSVVSCSENPFPSVSVKLCFKANESSTKMVRISLNPAFSHWYDRASVEGDWGTRLYGIPCKFCSYVLLYLPTIMLHHYQKNNVRVADRISNLDNFTRNKDLMNIDNPAFYEAQYHLNRIVEAFRNHRTLVSNFDPAQATRYLLFNRQGQLNREKERMEKGVVPQGARRGIALRTKALNEKREAEADVVCADYNDEDQNSDGLAAGGGGSTLGSEAMELLTRQSAHAHEGYDDNLPASSKFHDFLCVFSQ